MLRSPARMRQIKRLVRAEILRPQYLAFVPAVLLGGYWFGGEAALVLMSVLIPLVWLFGGMVEQGYLGRQHDPVTNLPSRPAFLERVDQAMRDFVQRAQSTLVMAIEIDDQERLAAELGPELRNELLRRVGERLEFALRGDDMVARVDTDRFAIVLGPMRGSDMDVGLLLADRIRSTMAEPLSIAARTTHVSVSIGFCLARRAPNPTSESIINAAEVALEDAQRAGKAQIRSYSSEIHAAADLREALAADLPEAFDKGQILPWFQPQISTDTGEVSGFEALARWSHPQRGLVSPGDFLPMVGSAGMLPKLGEVMLYHGLAALKEWDKAGFVVPRIAVNFSAEELRQPGLVDRVRWELDRFDLPPSRLAVEVLETVVEDTGDDSIGRNISALSQLGCLIDLDDFGTGHAAISNIRSFSIDRIKIDRSFVSNIDKDPTQQRMVSAILSMAEQLELETLAEGVETREEHALLAQLGCGHVQGFGLSRPMPFSDTLLWLERHRAKLEKSEAMGRQIGRAG